MGEKWWLFIFLAAFVGCVPLQKKAPVSSLRAARDLSAQGNRTGAIPLLENQIKAGQTPAEVYAYLGTLWSLQGDTARALEYYLTAVETDPQQVSFYINVATLYASLEEEKAAYEWFQKALQLDPQNQRARQFIENFDQDEKIYAEKIEALKASLKPQEETVEAFLKVARLYLLWRQWELAHDYLMKANQLSPPTYEVKVLLAQLAYRFKNFEEAIQWWEEAIAIDPQSLEAYVEAGRLYALLKQYEQAMRCWQQAKALSLPDQPEHQEALYYLKNLEPFQKKSDLQQRF